jgi:hypothetical protein
VLPRKQRILGILIMHRMRGSDVNDIDVRVCKHVCVRSACLGVFGVGSRENAVNELLGGGDGAGSDGGDEVLDVRGVTSAARELERRRGGIFRRHTWWDQESNPEERYQHTILDSSN